MKAPERIWIDNLDEGFWFDSPSGNKSVEYIRKDAFIEEVCEWLKESVTNNPECNRIISKKGVITMGLLIKDFRKYMEGE